jgi:transposase
MTLPPEPLDKDALITTLLERNASQAAEIERLVSVIAELEAKLKRPRKGPGNSSVPPSQGQKASGSQAPKTKSEPHAGAHRPLHPNPTSKRDVFAQQCACGADLSGVAQESRHAYDHVEIPKIEPDVIRVTLHGGVCPCCAKPFKAAPPEGLEPGSPFGPNLRALVIYLRSAQAIPLARLKDVLLDLLGVRISEGAIVNMLRAASPAFGEQAVRIKADLVRKTVVESDETGCRVGKKNWWLWVFHHADSALFVADPSRARTVVANFLGDWRPDYWLSDRYAGQMDWAKREHQVCLAHLIRDVQYVIDQGETVLAPGVLDLLKDACGIGRRRDELTDATLKTYAATLERRLDGLMALDPTTPAGTKLHRMLKKIRRHLFVFVTNPDLDATNNGSERAVRPCTIYRKITNGFRSPWAAAFYADTRSVIETGRRRSVRAIEAIRLTLAQTPIPTTA